MVDKILTIDRLTHIAIRRMREFCPPEGYYNCDSGGKDSTVVLELARMSGIKYDSHHHKTTVDPPEVIRFIRDHHGETAIEPPEKTMWRLIVENGIPPTRKMRYCCRLLKENRGEGRRILTGIRWSEGSARSRRGMTERCLKDGSKLYVNPIIDWTDTNVWEFISKHNLPYCSLYDEGFKRVGCVMCPMNRQRRKHEQRFPKFYTAYKRAFGRMLELRQDKGLKTSWRTPDDVMTWWLKDDGRSRQDINPVFNIFQ